MDSRKGVNRAILIYPLRKFEKVRDDFAALLGITDFETLEPPGFGIRIAISWETGLEIIAPLEETGGFADQARQFIEERGEGLFGLVWLVDEIDGAEARAHRAGFTTPGKRIDCLSANPGWRDRFSLALESALGEIHGVRLTLIQLERAAVRDADG